LEDGVLLMNIESIGIVLNNMDMITLPHNNNNNNHTTIVLFFPEQKQQQEQG
jgi:hypothetical protein